MNFVLETLKDTVLYVLNTLAHNSPALILGILVAAAIQVYVDPEKIKGWLMRRSSVSIPATVTFGAFTPFCACGTMAVVLSMLATALPWGPVMAFLVSSPLMSPEEFVMMSGILGPAFAIAVAVASVLIGMGSGYATHVIEKKTHFLDNQLRFASAKEEAQEAGCGCSAGGNQRIPALANVARCAQEDGCSCEEDDCGCDETVDGCDCGSIALQQPSGTVGSFFGRYRINQVLKAVFDIGIKRILPFFALFAGIGHLINQFIPTTWISALFGSHNLFAIPIAAVIGLPLYINGDSSIPLLQSLMQSGVSGGAMLAFMITGPGTSAGVMAGIATIMKKKAIALYIGYLLVGAIAMGYAYQLYLTFIGK
jgi:uncharacterized membrane protein YraQ (UPF0718 family)